ncbi:tautomerase family protein [Halomonas sp. B23F22_10]|uniref:tautomerase family protein n=1 Tax=Halomonas sp. B23F22_10 TaxID=3459515 RepID=UPI00373F1862
MPNINIQLIEGRSVEQKEALIEKITAACVEAIDCTPESVRVVLDDIAPQDFGIAGQSVARRRAEQDANA